MRITSNRLESAAVRRHLLAILLVSTFFLGRSALSQEDCSRDRARLEQLEEETRGCDQRDDRCPVALMDCRHSFNSDDCLLRISDRIAAWHQQHDPEAERLRNLLGGSICNPPAPPEPASYHGGPILTSFRVYPL